MELRAGENILSGLYIMPTKMKDIKSHVMEYHKIKFFTQIFPMSFERQEIAPLNFEMLQNFNLEPILMLPLHIQISIFIHQLLLHFDYSSRGSLLHPLLQASGLLSNTKNPKTKFRLFTNSGIKKLHEKQLILTVSNKGKNALNSLNVKTKMNNILSNDDSVFLSFSCITSIHLFLSKY